MAQVYSVNMVGYINKSIPAGFSMIANQLNASPNNQVVTLLPAPPANTTIFKFNATTGGYDTLSFVSGAWEGENTAMTLNPGEGAFIQAPSAFSNTFVGEVQLTSSVPLARGFQIISSALPQSLPLTPPTAGAPSLQFPAANGDEVYQFNPATGGYQADAFISCAWEGDTLPAGTPPTPDIGEAFFFNRPTAAPASWARTFSVGP
jgi:hypothetical protein